MTDRFRAAGIALLDRYPLATLADLLRRGEYAMHHSARYRDAYDPHYRIMRCEDARAISGPEG